MKPAPKSMTPLLEIFPLACRCTTADTFAPTLKSAWISPRRSCSVTATSPKSPVCSTATLCRRPSPAPGAATVMAMRTAAPLALSTHGWSGIAMTRCSGCTPEIVAFVGGGDNLASTTRRLKVWRRLLVVISPMRRVRPAATSPAAWCHQNITKSALSGTSGQAPRRACT